MTYTDKPLVTTRKPTLKEWLAEHERLHNEDKMNTYKFNCVVWVQGETQADALNELHDEESYLLNADNNLVALESDDGELVEEPDWFPAED